VDLLIVRDAFLAFAALATSRRVSESPEHYRCAAATPRENGILDPADLKNVCYQLTDRGRALLPAMVALMQWRQMGIREQAAGSCDR